MGQSFTSELIRLLKQARFVFFRHGKGDHDIWHSSRSGTSFPVDHKILSRHTANGVLGQAGLPKQF